MKNNCKNGNNNSAKENINKLIVNTENNEKLEQVTYSNT